MYWCCHRKLLYIHLSVILFYDFIYHVIMHISITVSQEITWHVPMGYSLSWFYAQCKNAHVCNGICIVQTGTWNPQGAGEGSMHPGYCLGAMHEDIEVYVVRVLNMCTIQAKCDTQARIKGHPAGTMEPWKVEVDCLFTISVQCVQCTCI